jgi:hypothetical protein
MIENFGVMMVVLVYVEILLLVEERVFESELINGCRVFS